MPLKIKHEHQPTRCEICHQQDCFDPIINSCLRCNGIDPNNMEISKPVDSVEYRAAIEDAWQIEFSGIASIVSVVIDVMIGGNGLLLTLAFLLGLIALAGGWHILMTLRDESNDTRAWQLAYQRTQLGRDAGIIGMILSIGYTIILVYKS